jgi:hypothetical protein
MKESSAFIRATVHPQNEGAKSLPGKEIIMTEHNSRRAEILLSTVLLLILWAFMLPLSAHAQGQWSTAGNGTDSYTNGQVGIGNTAPTDKLDVSGRVRFSLDAAFPGNNIASIYRSASSGLSFTGYNGTSASWYFANNLGQDTMYNPVGTTNVTFMGNMINVGATTAGMRLQIAANNSPTGGYPLIKLQTTQAGGHSWWLYAGALGNADGFGIYDETALAYRMYFNGSGYVGLGTQSPVQKLQVVGAIASTGTIAAGNTGTGAYLYDDGSYANLAALNGTNPRGLNVSGNHIIFSTGTTFGEKMRIDAAGNVGIGTSSPGARFYVRSGHDNATADIGQFLANNLTQGIGIGYNRIEAVGSNTNQDVLLLPKGTGKVEIGATATNPTTTTLAINGSINVTGNINAKYQDVAEWVPSSQKLSAGTVVILDPERTNQVIASTESYDTRVAGVISEQPGLILGEAGEGKVKVATTGRVRVRVDATRGEIRVGDLLVTSDEEGVAMKSEAVIVAGGIKMHRPGTLIGKALEPLKSGRGEILVLLSLQ